MAKTFDNISEASATNYLFLFAQRTLALQNEPPTPPPLNAGFAYRVRDTDVNVSGGFSQGRGQLQVSAVDDETIMEGDPALVTAPSHGHVGVSVVL